MIGAAATLLTAGTVMHVHHFCPLQQAIHAFAKTKPKADMKPVQPELALRR